ncbi:hypothetical protein V9T40_005747 [Parthenolecanium corni]|uniref:Uncharacterized protein n=1 Tax=Parthenolecanium corni TaxID=536013 RepID=A0AAN9TWW7_9HEMI
MSQLPNRSLNFENRPPASCTPANIPKKLHQISFRLGCKTASTPSSTSVTQPAASTKGRGAQIANQHGGSDDFPREVLLCHKIRETLRTQQCALVQ